MESRMNETETVHSGCSVVSPTLVYAWTKTKEEFDSIALPEKIHAWKESDVITLLRNDGRKWERRTFSKSMDGGPVSVVFQWVEERPIEAEKE